jgi:hypothetical protein
MVYILTGQLRIPSTHLSLSLPPCRVYDTTFFSQRVEASEKALLSASINHITRSTMTSCSRLVCITLFFFLLSSACQALTADESEQNVAMVMDKIETAAQERELQQGDGDAISVAVGCYAQWTALITTQPFTNNTALYLCDGMSDTLPSTFPTLVIPAGVDVTISCLGICTVNGGGINGTAGAFQVQAGGRLDLFGIDFVNINGVSKSVAGCFAFYCFVSSTSLFYE